MKSAGTFSLLFSPIIIFYNEEYSCAAVYHIGEQSWRHNDDSLMNSFILFHINDSHWTAQKKPNDANKAHKMKKMKTKNTI